MNERILELAEQSERYALHLRRYCDHNDFDRTRDIKFAELIIKECAQCIDIEIGRLAEYHISLNESETEKRNDVELCMKKCYDNIELLKTHFGVEE